jgi:hypothetical protein
MRKGKYRSKLKQGIAGYWVVIETKQGTDHILKRKGSKYRSKRRKVQLDMIETKAR